MTASEPRPARKRLDDYTRRRLFLRIGQAIMVAGGIMGLVHWLTHLEAFGSEQPPLLVDLAIGYPMAALLLILGGVVASRKPKAPAK
ncbi:MAG: hypothetical protein RIA38_08865 [Microcella pacifica]|uniref:hypothetical protein n=1 Tax=Microcella pacifica TaxID=2591847 RepID=UPI0033158B96